MESLIQLTGLKSNAPLDVEQAVRERYSSASQVREASLCCPVQYDGRYLAVLPDELIERDYGCGDPSQYVGPGDRVLDLGSGGGKICYIASQIVGPTGRVTGVDMNDDMLMLAREHRSAIGDRIGWHNVEFFKGRIQDLGLDLERFERHLSEHPIRTSDDWLAAERESDRRRRDEPMIADNSLDVVLSNCVLNLVTPRDRQQLFSEIYRVLDRGGRAVISDIVSDEPVPERLKNNPELWSGCISGAFVEHEFLECFEQAGFHGIEILARQTEPWATVEGIEFRSLTVRAFKGKDGPCRDHHQAVIYRGPWHSVKDDDGHVLRRGVRTAVCEKTYRIYTQAPYQEHVVGVPPLTPVDPATALDFDCLDSSIRDPAQTKAGPPAANSVPGQACCGPEGCC